MHHFNIPPFLSAYIDSCSVLQQEDKFPSKVPYLYALWAGEKLVYKGGMDIRKAKASLDKGADMFKDCAVVNGRFATQLKRPAIPMPICNRRTQGMFLLGVPYESTLLVQILGIKTTTSQEEIKAAYYRYALQENPKKNPHDESLT